MASAEAIPSYQGWGRVEAQVFGPCSMELGHGCLPGGPSTFVAYQWSYNLRQWSRTSRPASTQVYIYPYGGAWRWTWTQDRGWLAMRAGDLRIPMAAVAV